MQEEAVSCEKYKADYNCFVKPNLPYTVDFIFDGDLVEDFRIDPDYSASTNSDSSLINQISYYEKYFPVSEKALPSTRVFIKLLGDDIEKRVQVNFFHRPEILDYEIQNCDLLRCNIKLDGTNLFNIEVDEKFSSGHGYSVTYKKSGSSFLAIVESVDSGTIQNLRLPYHSKTPVPLMEEYFLVDENLQFTAPANRVITRLFDGYVFDNSLYINADENINVNLEILQGKEGDIVGKTYHLKDQDGLNYGSLNIKKKVQNHYEVVLTFYKDQSLPQRIEWDLDGNMVEFRNNFLAKPKINRIYKSGFYGNTTQSLILQKYTEGSIIIEGENLNDMDLYSESGIQFNCERNSPVRMECDYLLNNPSLRKESYTATLYNIRDNYKTSLYDFKFEVVDKISQKNLAEYVKILGNCEVEDSAFDMYKPSAYKDFSYKNVCLIFDRKSIDLSNAESIIKYGPQFLEINAAIIDSRGYELIKSTKKILVKPGTGEYTNVHTANDEGFVDLRERSILISELIDEEDIEKYGTADTELAIKIHPIEKYYNTTDRIDLVDTRLKRKRDMTIEPNVNVTPTAYLVRGFNFYRGHELSVASASSLIKFRFYNDNGEEHPIKINSGLIVHNPAGLELPSSGEEASVKNRDLQFIAYGSLEPPTSWHTRNGASNFVKWKFGLGASYSFLENHIILVVIPGIDIEF